MAVIRLAWREFRAHPSRQLATLLAIIIAVGFLAATQVQGPTERQAAQSRAALYTTRSDVIVNTYLWHSKTARSQRDRALETASLSLRQNPDVVSLEEFTQLHVELTHGDRVASTMLMTSPVHDELRWFTTTEGRLPAGEHELVLTTQVADALGVHIGDTVTVSNPAVATATVVGLTSERGYADPPTYVAQSLLHLADTGFPPPLYQVLVDPKQTSDTTPGSSGDGIGISYLVKTQPGKADAVAAATQRDLDRAGFMRLYATAKTSAAVRGEVAAAVGARPDLTGALVTGSALVALLVGALIISNTFAILVEQRRRQIGLLRTLGASRGQLWWRFVLEALGLGVVGSVIGVAAGIAAAAALAKWWTHSLAFGLVVPWPVLALVTLGGVAATVVAALIPVRQAVAVRPLEALRPSLPRAGGRRAVLLVAAAACLALGLAALFAATHGAMSQWLRIDLAAAGAVGVLLGILLPVSLWGPWLLRTLGRAFPHSAAVPRLACSTAAKSPGRVGITSAALVIAVALISAVHVGTSTGQAGAFADLDRRYPADVVLQSALQEKELLDANASGQAAARDANGHLAGFADGALERVRSAPGVTGAAMLQTSEPVLLHAQVSTQWLPLTAMTPEANALLRRPVTLQPDQIGLTAATMAGLNTHPGEEILLTTLATESVRLTIVEVEFAKDLVLVSQGVMDQLKVYSKPGAVVVKLAQPNDGDSVVTALRSRLAADNPGLSISGSAREKSNVRALLGGLAALLTGLLAIASIVALVGVANTLGLSVLERARESALLRAIGLPRRGLWELLLIEALALTAFSAVVGLAAGIGLGYALALAVLRSLGLAGVAPAGNAGLLALTCLAVLAASALASIIPGLRAARATPVQALAEAQ